MMQTSAKPPKESVADGNIASGVAEVEIRCSMVAVVVVKGEGADAQVLLLQRENAYMRGVWSYVAGHVEPNETAWQAACRELAEETAIVPRALYATGFCEQFYVASDDCIMIVPAFVALVDENCQARLNGEHSASRWLKFKAAMRELPFGSQRDLFAHVHREFIDRPPSEHLRIAF